VETGLPVDNQNNIIHEDGYYIIDESTGEYVRVEDEYAIYRDDAWYVGSTPPEAGDQYFIGTVRLDRPIDRSVSDHEIFSGADILTRHQDIDREKIVSMNTDNTNYLMGSQLDLGRDYQASETTRVNVLMPTEEEPNFYNIYVNPEDGNETVVDTEGYAIHDEGYYIPNNEDRFFGGFQRVEEMYVVDDGEGGTYYSGVRPRDPNTIKDIVFVDVANATMNPENVDEYVYTFDEVVSGTDINRKYVP
jgi:hypothetical protein